MENGVILEVRILLIHILTSIPPTILLLFTHALSFFKVKAFCKQINHSTQKFPITLLTHPNPPPIFQNEIHVYVDLSACGKWGERKKNIVKE